MLKKSKRILSLVLALIMICSTMGVMAFAAETGDEGPVYITTGSSGEFDITYTYRGRTYSTRARMFFECSYYEMEDDLIWDSLTCTFTTVSGGTFSAVANTSNPTFPQITIYFTEAGSGSRSTAAVITVTYNRYNDVRANCLVEGSTTSPRIVISLTFEIV